MQRRYSLPAMLPSDQAVFLLQRVIEWDCFSILHDLPKATVGPVVLGRHRGFLAYESGTNTSVGFGKVAVGQQRHVGGGWIYGETGDQLPVSKRV